MHTSYKDIDTKHLAYWLFACCGLVFLMVIVGAITRLTDSGLSIVEWRPLLGTLPPLTETEWERVYSLYKQSPEFAKKHFWMDMHDFKMIFFWEWFHRILGRLIGVVYAVPLIWFWIRNRVPQNARLKLTGLFLLGGFQGLLGWYMVQSGLVDEPSVSHYRLAAHLSLAFLIYSLMLWLGLDFLEGNKHKPAWVKSKSLLPHACLCLILVVLTIIWGAFTAGLDAGLIYNDTFPRMGGHWIPSEIQSYSPIWHAFLEDHTGVQFIHRWLAIATGITVLSLWTRNILSKNRNLFIHLLGAMICIQLVLGIATLLTHVNIAVAVSHQAGALITLSLLIATIRSLKTNR